MEPEQLSSAFPFPPPYFKYFTFQNLNLLKSNDIPDSSERLRQLEYLVPPPAPVQGSYSSFGDVWPLPERLPSLTEMGVTQLYSTDAGSDRTVELRTLTKSALMNYLELVGIMGVDPAGWTEKIEDLRIIFVNMHHLLNEYRPHQARETLCMMMEEEIERTRAEIQGIEEACEKVEEALNRVVNGEEVSGGMDDGEKVEDNLGEDTMEDKLGDDKMEDVQGGDEIPDATTSGEQKWYERKELLDLWNGA